MGTVTSHEKAASTATPPKPEAYSRVLQIDPRSPSTEIVRTPIIVEKTPVFALDPRSPTVGIVRTPLSQIPPPKLVLDADVEPVEQSADITEPQQEDAEPRDLCTGDGMADPLEDTDLHCLSLDDFPTSESTRLVPADTEPMDALGSFTCFSDILVPVETEKVRVNKKSRAPQPKELFPNRKAEPVRKDMTRSPLSTRNVEMNSPLKIVQRKQTHKLEKARKCSSETSSSRFIVKDKENM